MPPGTLRDETRNIRLQGSSAEVNEREPRVPEGRRPGLGG
jgi:hypothetical protein